MKTNIYQKVRNMAKAALPLGLLTLTAFFGACSPDSFEGADENGIPTMEGIDFSMSVDQEVNQVILKVPEMKGVYPVWTINGATYSTLNEVGWSNVERGTYPVELRLANRNGISQGCITKYFTFDETKINYTAMFNRIKDKQWRIDNAEVAHMACGPVGGDGTGWWSANPDEKKDFGVYDDRLTFTVETNKGGTYTYNPGADGKTYVNYGTTIWGSEPEPDRDVATEEQTSSWYFQRGTWTDAEGKEIEVDYLVLADNTLFPYISSDNQYQHPRFRIETLTASKMVLIYEAPDNSIAWRFILTSKEAAKTFEGFDANSDFNLWKGITPVMSFHFQPGWGEVRTPEMESTFVSGDNDYTVTVPDACADRWQAQMHFHTDLVTNASTHYDFSCILNADKDIDGVTLKLTCEDDSKAMIDVSDISLKAGEDFVFWKSDLEGVDLNTVKLVFDFGYASQPVTVNVRNIVLKDHANDDGTVLPDDGGEGGGGDTPEATMDWDYNASTNLWKAVDDGSKFEKFGYYFATGSDWQSIPYNEATHSGDTYEIDLPENIGTNQWQAQFHIDTYLTASASKKYNFYLVMEADADLPQVTFKLTDSGDNNYFFEERQDVTAGSFVFKKEGVSLKEGTDASAVRMFFDFGGSPAGTHVKISKIYFEEVFEMNYDDADNLWKAVDDGSLFDAFGYYFATGGDWQSIPYNEATHSGNTYEIDLPENIGTNQWQAQFHIDTKLTASASKQYAFQLVMEADNDLPQVTFKLTDSGDNNYFFEERIDVPGGEPFTLTRKGLTLKEGKDASAIRMFFDFGGSPGGTHVKISKIILKEM